MATLDDLERRAVDLLNDPDASEAQRAEAREILNDIARRRGESAASTSVGHGLTCADIDRAMGISPPPTAKREPLAGGGRRVYLPAATSPESMADYRRKYGYSGGEG